MSYIQSSLGDGERVIATVRFHWLYMFIAILALLVLGWVLIGIWIFAVMAMRYWTTEIGVTTHRFIMKTGWIRRDTQEISLDNIEGVQVHQSIWGRIFGFGQLVVQGTGVDAVRLPPMLADPVAFRRAIESARGDRSP